MSSTSTAESVQSVVADDTTCEWLRTALQSALQRDPVDSLNDALLLAGSSKSDCDSFFDLSGLQELEEVSSEED